MALIKRALIVDDDPSIRIMLASLLEKEAITSYAVSSAEEAVAFISRCEKDHIQVILSDIKLPGINGLQFCKKMKKMEPLIVMIALTGHGNLYSLMQCRESGFDDYLKKPFSISVLRAALVGAFKRARYWETLVRRELSSERIKKKPISGVEP